MKFVPNAVPFLSDSIRAWLADQFRQIAATLAAPTIDVAYHTILHAPPDRIEDGIVVYADGVDWNPGAGVGIYARVSGAWVKMT